MAVYSIVPSTARSAGIFGGAFEISAIVKELGALGKYRVGLFSRWPLALVAETWSAPDGSYRFSQIADRDQQYFVVAFDHGANPVNAAVSDYITYPALAPMDLG